MFLFAFFASLSYFNKLYGLCIFITITHMSKQGRRQKNFQEGGATKNKTEK